MQTLRIIILCALAATVWGESLTPERKSKVDTKAKQLQSWSADPAIVAAVKAHNASAPADSKGHDQ